MFPRNTPSSFSRFLILWVSLVLLPGCESGHVVEVRIAPEGDPPTDPQLVEMFSGMASSLGRSVSGPLTGPGSDVRYVAHPNSPDADRHYDLSMMFLRDRKSIYIRTFATQSPKDWASRPLAEIRRPLDSMGIAYRVREN
jgi:hypothetical protein